MLHLLRAAFEIVALAAGRLGALSLAAQSIIMTADQSMCLFSAEWTFTHSLLVLNTIPFGIGEDLSLTCGDL